jgi:hypothetical protein
MSTDMPSRPVLLRGLLAAAVVISGAGVVGVAGASSSTVTACNHPILVLSAMPVEISPLLEAAKITKTVTVEHRDFYVGTLRGHNVVMAMTRIGPVNATLATTLAVETFRCGSHSAFSAAVFSGVAGGDYIGNVAVPTRWTLDDGKNWLPVDQRMLKTAKTLEHAKLGLEQETPMGDPLCTCVIDPDTVRTNAVLHKPALKVRGNGRTTDPFGGRAIPCVPSDSDVFGCDPCPVAHQQGRDAADFPTGIMPFVGPGFFTGYLQPAGKSKYSYAADDEETAAVDKVLVAAQVPFIAFRAASDGTATAGGTMPPGGDPVGRGLVGFPVTFLYYRQLAADNAALATMAFLKAWRGNA